MAFASLAKILPKIAKEAPKYAPMIMEGLSKIPWPWQKKSDSQAFAQPAPNFVSQDDYASDFESVNEMIDKHEAALKSLHETLATSFSQLNDTISTHTEILNNHAQGIQKIEESLSATLLELDAKFQQAEKKQLQVTVISFVALGASILIPLVAILARR
jgi:hypothetical protein